MSTVNSRVQKHREALRHAGLRPIQHWVPDTRGPGFAEECRLQAMAVAALDSKDASLDALMDEGLEDLKAWNP
jgi:hypothetical protein